MASLICRTAMRPHVLPAVLPVENGPITRRGRGRSSPMVCRRGLQYIPPKQHRARLTAGTMRMRRCNTRRCFDPSAEKLTLPQNARGRFLAHLARRRGERMAAHHPISADLRWPPLGSVWGQIQPFDHGRGVADRDRLWRLGRDPSTSACGTSHRFAETAGWGQKSGIGGPVTDIDEPML